jgi:pimeloyl-ACP methyl ester carboxylesterase
MNAIALRNSSDEFEGGTGIDTWSRLAEITAPTTVLCGDLDVAEIFEASEQLAQLLPAARYHVIAGTAHMPYLEQPAAVAALVIEALVRAA